VGRGGEKYFGAEPRAFGARLGPKSPQEETAHIRIGITGERLNSYTPK